MIKNIIILALSAALLSGGYLANSTIGNLETAITALHIKHTKDILKTKIKERGKRVLTALPVAGLIAFGWFEKLEYDEWKEENPDGTPEQYSSEVADLVYEMAASYYEEMKNELPVAGTTELNVPEKPLDQTSNSLPD